MQEIERLQAEQCRYWSTRLNTLSNKKRIYNRGYCDDPQTVFEVFTPDMEYQQVRCNKCEGCMQHRFNQWRMAAIAESMTARSAWVITLTWRDGETGAVIDAYSDVQKMIKRMRAAGYPCRYLFVPEKGSKKGRPHDHGIIWFQDRQPPRGEMVDPREVTKRQSHQRLINQYWPHGHVTIQTDVSVTGIVYCLKYLTKGDLVKVRASQSIGRVFLDQHARANAANGAVPLRNWFDFGMVFTGKAGAKDFRYIGPLPKKHWVRYRETVMQVRKEKGLPPLPAEPQYSSYENILTPEEREEFTLYSDEKRWQETLNKRALAYADFHKVAEKDGCTMRLAKRGAQNYMLIRADRPLPWMTGRIHKPGNRFPKALHTFDTARFQAVAISPEQAAYIRFRQKPKPESDPAVMTDWITGDAARKRRAQKLPSAHERALQNNVLSLSQLTLEQESAEPV